MKTSRKKIATVISDKTLAKGVTKKLVNEVAALLISEHRVNDLSSIVRDVQSDWLEAGYIDVIATSAHKIDDATKKKIIRTFKELYPKAKTVNISEKYDPEIIGGVRLSLAEAQLDLSIENKLNKLKQSLSERKD